MLFQWVMHCIMRHKKRHDFRALLLQNGLKKNDYYQGIATGDNSAFIEPIKRIAAYAAESIANRHLELRPPRIRTRMDNTTGKIRQIGEESAMQQVFDYIAVFAAKEIWLRRIVPQQVSSIKGRGQIHGKNIIKGWIDSDIHATAYAKKHGLTYNNHCKYHTKLDIRKCYPTANKDIFLDLFAKDCGNDDLIWLWRALLATHNVGGYTGFMIGALTSQWACQFMLSFVYRHAMSLTTKRRNKPIRLVSHMLLFMDDMLLVGPSRKNLKMAVRSVAKMIKTVLGWNIKETWQIQDIENHPIDMMGYVMHKSGKVTIRAKDFIRARRMLLRAATLETLTIEQARRMASQKGFFTNSNSSGVMKALDAKTHYRTAAEVISKYDKERAKHENLL